MWFRPLALARQRQAIRRAAAQRRQQRNMSLIGVGNSNYADRAAMVAGYASLNSKVYIPRIASTTSGGLAGFGSNGWLSFFLVDVATGAYYSPLNNIYWDGCLIICVDRAQWDIS